MEDNYHGGFMSPAIINLTQPPTANQLDLVAVAVEEETYAADGTGEAHLDYPVIATFRRASASAYEFDMQVTIYPGASSSGVISGTAPTRSEAFLAAAAELRRRYAQEYCALGDNPRGEDQRRRVYAFCDELERMAAEE